MSESERLTLKSLSKKKITPPEMANIYRDILTGPDRSGALVAATLVDLALEKTISSHFVKLTPSQHKSLFGPMGPISSFSSRIKIGFALGLYDTKLTNMLDIIREIRNAFAHTAISLNFDNSLIAKECQKLPDIQFQTGLGDNLSANRHRFSVVCINIVQLFEEHISRRIGQCINIDMPNNNNDRMKQVHAESIFAR